jgi:hypothetical protein
VIIFDIKSIAEQEKNVKMLKMPPLAQSLQNISVKPTIKKQSPTRQARKGL